MRVVLEASDDSSELDGLGAASETASPFRVTVVDSDDAEGTLSSPFRCAVTDDGVACAVDAVVVGEEEHTAVEVTVVILVTVDSLDCEGETIGSL